jgi:hypothetical protein
LPSRRQDADGDREVEGGAFLSDIGGGEIDGDALQRERVARVGEGGVDAVPPFPDGALRQTDRHEGGEAIGDVGLDLHQIGVDTEDGGGAHAGEHTPMVRVARPQVVAKTAHRGPNDRAPSGISHAPCRGRTATHLVA